MKKEINLATTKYVDDKIAENGIKSIMFKGNNLPKMPEKNGKPLYLVNENQVSIDATIFPSWTHWYFPLYYSNNDCIGFAIYPTAISFAIIGHTSEGYYAKKVF